MRKGHWDHTKKVDVSLTGLVGDSQDLYLRNETLFRPATVAVLVSCAGHQHKSPLFHCSDSESMAVVLQVHQSVNVEAEPINEDDNGPNHPLKTDFRFSPPNLH